MLQTTIKNWGWKANLALGFFSVVFFFTITELTLYLTGFNYSQFPRFMNIKMVNSYIDWQSSNTVIQHFTPHKKRMWASMPNKGIVNSLGYIGQEIPLERVPGVKRILFLGDSCTGGTDYYPDRTIKILNAQLGVKTEPLIAATGGYSTFQGLDVLKESVKYKPDLIISYFGWNDHWLAIGGLPDHEFKELTALQLFIHKASSKSRTYQLLHYMIYPPHKYFSADSPTPGNVVDLSRFVRVPIDSYFYNLREMIKIAGQNKAPIYFIAAPIGPHITEVNTIHVPNSYILPIHSFYLDILEKVSAESANSHFIDFRDTVFDKSLMMGDGIHPTAKGHDLIAERVAKILLESGKLDFKSAGAAVADGQSGD